MIENESENVSANASVREVCGAMMALFCAKDLEIDCANAWLAGNGERRTNESPVEARRGAGKKKMEKRFVAVRTFDSLILYI